MLSLGEGGKSNKKAFYEEESKFGANDNSIFSDFKDTGILICKEKVAKSIKIV